MKNASRNFGLAGACAAIFNAPREMRSVRASVEEFIAGVEKFLDEFLLGCASQRRSHPGIPLCALFRDGPAA